MQKTIQVEVVDYMVKFTLINFIPCYLLETRPNLHLKNQPQERFPCSKLLYFFLFLNYLNYKINTAQIQMIYIKVQAPCPDFLLT